MKTRRLNAEQLRKLRLASSHFEAESKLEVGFNAGIRALALYLNGHEVDYIQEVLSPAYTENPPFWDIIEATFQPSDEPV